MFSFGMHVSRFVIFLSSVSETGPEGHISLSQMPGMGDRGHAVPA